MTDANLLARRKAAYRPGRRFPGGQPGNLNALKGDPDAWRRSREATALLRECRAWIRFLKPLRDAGKLRRVDRHVYIINRDGKIEERIYEIRRGP